MTRRKILDMTSKKKRDTRLLTTNLRITGGGNNEYFPAPAQLNSANGTVISIHCPTAMDRNFAGLQGGGHGEIPSYRTQSDVYMKGYSDKYRFTFADGAPWRHRRITFTLKGTALIKYDTASGNPSAQQGLRLYAELNPAGWTRTLNNIAGSAAGSALVTYLFKGSNGADWRDIFTAKTDNTSLTIKSDRTRYLKSDNDNVHSSQYGFYDKLESSFYYDDDEDGQNSSDTYNHRLGKPGMGDYYVVDIIECVNPAAGVQAQLDISSTLYWHEK